LPVRRLDELEVSMSARFPNESEAVRSKQTRFREERSSDLEDVTFLRLPEVKAVAGLSKTSLYTLIRDRNFPAPVQLGPRAVAWVRAEVKKWAASRVLASRSAACLTSGKRMPHSVRSESET
jgi:prophage regulatory protein